MLFSFSGVLLGSVFKKCVLVLQKCSLEVFLSNVFSFSAVLFSSVFCKNMFTLFVKCCIIVL